MLSMLQQSRRSETSTVVIPGIAISGLLGSSFISCSFVPADCATFTASRFSCWGPTSERTTGRKNVPFQKAMSVMVAKKLKSV